MIATGLTAQAFRRRATARAAAVLLATAPLAASALDFTLDSLGVTGSLRAQVGAGAAVRMQGRDRNLVGKLNLPGQEQFCEDKAPAGSPPGTPAPGQNCQTAAGNAAYLALPGYPGVNNDNGDLNYDRHDPISAVVKIAPRLQLTRDNFGLDVSALYFYDQVNSNFTEFHPNNFEDNNGFQPRHTPRDKSAEDKVGSAFHLLDAFVSGSLPLPGERQLSFKLGNQVLSIGTSTLLVLNSLNVINPPDANIRFLPTFDTREVFQRIPLLDVSTSVNESLSVETFYAFQWKPVVVPPIGSYFSTIDVFGSDGGYAMALFGKYREDPNSLISGGSTGQDRTQGNIGQLSDANRTLYTGPTHDARNGGEYGLTLNYFAQELNNTSFTLSYMNLHSRLPTVSFIAAQKGCSHDATDQATAVADCNGFKTAANNHSGGEIGPVDTVKLFLEYPEDIHILGGSFSTNLGAVALTGEIVFRPNQPLQVDATDLGFAALQPMFPAGNIVLQPAPAPAPPLTIPSRRVAVPDYVMTIYRKQDVTPGMTIRGYERFKTINYNASTLFLFGASENPFGADQVTLLTEVGGLQILGLPSLDQLQIGSPGTTFHHSAGVDGTGTPNDLQMADSNTGDRLNPSYQASGYATPFSWGYRVLGQLSYEDVLPSVKLNPQFTFFHDVHGRAPMPTAEFVQGRKQAMLGLAVSYGSNWSGALRYNWFFGGGYGNPLSDRDYLQLNVGYDF